MARILSIGPDVELLTTRNRALARLGHDVSGAATRVNALTLAKSQHSDIALLCHKFLPAYASQLAKELRALMPGTPIAILLGGPDSVGIEEIEEIIREKRQRPKAA